MYCGTLKSLKRINVDFFLSFSGALVPSLEEEEIIIE